MKENLKILETKSLFVHLFSKKKQVPLLKNISLSLGPGEFLGVVGKSGAGKTLLVRSLAGLLPPMARVTAGEIRYRGRLLDHTSPLTWHSLWGREIFVMFQSAAQALNPSLTLGRQLIEAIAKGRQKGKNRSVSMGRSPGANKDDIEKFLGAVGLSPNLALQYPFEISGGMRQRIQVAMAMALRPKVLIADEPSTGLDPKNQAVIMELMAGLNRDFGTAVILVSHDIRTVAGLCGRVLILDQGQVVETGTSSRVFSRPETAAARYLVENMRLLEGGCLCRKSS